MSGDGTGRRAKAASIAKVRGKAIAGAAARPGAAAPRRPPASARRYIALWKPYDVLSQFTAELPGQRTLAECGLPGGVYPAGRLDRDSEGLLLLTDDGPLIKRLLAPGSGHPRTYWVQVDGVPDDVALERLRAGVPIKGGRTLPCAAATLDVTPDLPPRDPPIRARKSVPTTWLALTLREGKNRQVRRMTAAIGHPTLRLVRVAIGGVTLDGLRPGGWRTASRAEIEGSPAAAR